MDLISLFIDLGLFLSPLYLFFRILKSRKRLFIPVLLIYFISYLPFSLLGEYKLSNHGGSDWRNEWHPHSMIIQYTAPSGRTKSYHSHLGAIFWPCISVDRYIWHRTRFE